MSDSTCAIDECPNKRLDISRGWCSTHYGRWRRTGDPLVRYSDRECAICSEEFTPTGTNQKYCTPRCARKAESAKRCAFEGCERGVRYNGMCVNHARQDRRQQPVRTGRCANCGEMTEFTATRSQYCGRSCSSQAMHKSGLGGKRASPLTAAFQSGDPAAFTEGVKARTTEDADGCWLWNGKLNTSGYVVASVAGKKRPLHRLILEVHSGGTLGSLEAHHTCAKASCLNPEHIIAVTKAQNIAEMRARRTLERRISELESALHQIAPDHILLTHTST